MQFCCKVIAHTQKKIDFEEHPTNIQTHFRNDVFVMLPLPGDDDARWFVDVALLHLFSSPWISISRLLPHDCVFYQLRMVIGFSMECLNKSHNWCLRICDIGKTSYFP